MTHLLHSSVADIPEGLLVKQLLALPQWRAQLLNIHGFPENAEDYQNVPLAGLPADPEGDIDILLCASTQPHRATAIQVKRIKVGQRALANSKPNKLDDYAKGIQQTNLLADLGFWQVYLYVFVVVDSRAQNDGRNSYAGMPPTLGEQLRSYFLPADLAKRAGLILFEFVQPMDYAPLGPGTSSTQLVRGAGTVTAQPKVVTEWVARQIATRRPDGPPSGLIVPPVARRE
jgi:hypothetical protein